MILLLRSRHRLLQHRSGSLAQAQGIHPSAENSPRLDCLCHCLIPLTKELRHLRIFLKNFQHKSNISRTSTSNIIMPRLIKSWLQSTSASILDKQLDQTKAVKLCCLEILRQIRLKGRRLNPLTRGQYQVTTGEVSSKLPKLHGMWLSSASHSTPQVKLCQSSTSSTPQVELCHTSNYNMCLIVLTLMNCLVP